MSRENSEDEEKDQVIQTGKILWDGIDENPVNEDKGIIRMTSKLSLVPEEPSENHTSFFNDRLYKLLEA